MSVRALLWAGAMADTLLKNAAAETWGLRPGDEIDDTLVVLGHIGGGHRYEVFRAWDRELFCQVAVKAIRPHRVISDRTINGLDREASIAARLAHPNLVRLLRTKIDGERPYIVLELITAQTVADHLRDIGAVSVPEMCLLGIRMLSALHHMHSHHVLHLDVKPSNLTMGAPPRLLDLSLARVFATGLRMRSSIGTAAYMPPEQCDHGFATPASDVFGLGATMYEALTAMQPFREGDRDSKVREERYPQLVEDPLPLRDIVPAIPPDLEAVVMRSLDRDQERRPSVLDAAIALEKVLEDLGVKELQAWPKGTKVRPKNQPM